MTFSILTGAFVLGAGALNASSPLLSGADLSSPPVQIENTDVLNANIPLHVVELFGSQGCSSCPPANALMGELTREPSVLGLSYGVEYWDYMGWKDTFADPAFSSRQHSYSVAIGHKRVYTPQIIVNGSFDKHKLEKSDVLSSNIQSGGPAIHLSQDGTLSLGEAQGINATVRAIRYVPGQQTVPVNRGENKGRVLTLTNVVTGIDKLGGYSGQAQDYSLSQDATSALLDAGSAIAILVQKDDCGTILAAASYAL